MKRIAFILFVIISVQFLYAQELTLLQGQYLVTETDIYLDENNNKYSDLITINFNGNIIDFSQGESEASIEDIDDDDVKDYLYSLEILYGDISLEKVFPAKSWGDTVGTNRRTGESVTINDLSQVFQIHFSGIIPIESITTELSNYTAIDYAVGPYEIYTLSTEPDDPWYTNGDHWNLDSVFAKFAWDYTLGDTTITISINDFYFSTVTTLHEDLVDKVDYHYYNFYGGHGTAVAGVAGCTTDNNLGQASLGWNLRLRLDRNGYQGIEDAIEDSADVINFSWLGAHPTLKTIIHNALLQGIVCVGGAGNGFPTPPFVAYPAAYNFGNDGQVIAVSATQLDPLYNYTEHFAYTWNHSPGSDPISDPTNAFIDVCAPGVLVPLLSAYWSNYYVFASGTSFSSPLVAALAGLILSIDNSLTPPQVYNIITSTADKIDPNGAINYQYDENGWSRWMGYGRINAHDALNVASGAPHRPRDLVVSANALDEAQLDWNSIAEEVSQYKIYRAHTNGEPPVNWSLAATINAWVGFPNPIAVTSWTDVGTIVGSGSQKLWYHIVAVNNELLESLPSNTDWIAWNKYGKKNYGKQIAHSSEYGLENNYPNPFNPSTTIKYTLRENGFVSLKVYDILGREVAGLINEKQPAGSYNVTFNASGLVSGVYFYKLIVNDFIEVKKMILTK
jgi:subtilisin family serine protease